MATNGGTNQTIGLRWVRRLSLLRQTPPLEAARLELAAQAKQGHSRGPTRERSAMSLVGPVTVAGAAALPAL
ncbi:hypothetical protein IVB33_30070 [Bradyrhizobium sp. 24]|uniref:hypothetical protein n=1 Tax=unclassified Bradyrhizobium TaxID=2631580 RepID=UPI001FF9554B|nr:MULTISPECIES: hypothetical protein [unclassified Bradyrhizobium]MCK1304110.1 hypothetical protein [Bradyrhizobium sp. 37]MCK1381146.1 hypothetical protein [Bradyrhizobium sp. 24]MCK1768558.1 hypothetical protein [Bradyrhizobium sp. 134]